MDSAHEVSLSTNGKTLEGLSALEQTTGVNRLLVLKLMRVPQKTAVHCPVVRLLKPVRQAKTAGKLIRCGKNCTK